MPNQLPDSLANLGVSDGQSLNLFVFYHPRCPCTQSTARNLAKISAFLRNDVNLTAFAYVPAEANESWLETSTTREFAGIPGCTIALDSEAKMSRLFEVHTSGHVLLYGHRGELLFSGGITPSRGHEGDCRSGNDLVRLINDGLGSKDVPVEWPSFGCRIYSEEEIL
ncbi:MAG: RedB [Aureliella sp.]